VKAANDRRIESLSQRVADALGGSLAGRRIAIFGLAFKADTDDMRRAPSLTLVPALTRAGASVAACDPVAMAAARRHFTGIDWYEEPYEAATGADAVVVLTEWNLFRGLDLERLKAAMKTPLVVDFRNIYLTGEMARAGFTYISLGRPPVVPS
jgi:UDPglucose 6-dehydrogenase